jgi:hypothetical protein
VDAPINKINMNHFNMLPQNETTQNETRGVNFEPGKNKWRVRIPYRSKEYHLGYFVEKDDAIKRRAEAESHLNGDFIGWYNKVYRKG